MQISVQDIYGLLRIDQLRSGQVDTVLPSPEPLDRLKAGFQVTRLLNEKYGQNAEAADDAAATCRRLMQ